MEKIALIGSKEFARQIREYAEETMIFQVVGYFDDYEPTGKMVDGDQVLTPRTPMSMNLLTVVGDV